MDEINPYGFPRVSVSDTPALNGLHFGDTMGYDILYPTAVHEAIMRQVKERERCEKQAAFLLFGIHL